MSILILFDRFSLQNANAVVFATSGAGKSYAIKLEVIRSLMMGTDVVIIDPEKEYQHLSEAVGGTYINLSLSSNSKLNPFDLPKGLTKDMKTADIIRSAVITLKGLIRLMVGKLSHLEDWPASHFILPSNIHEIYILIFVNYNYWLALRNAWRPQGESNPRFRRERAMS